MAWGAMTGGRGGPVWVFLFVLAILGVIIAVRSRDTPQFRIVGIVTAVVSALAAVALIISSGGQLI